MVKDKQIVFRTTVEQYERIKRLSNIQNVTMAELLNRIVDETIKKNEAIIKSYEDLAKKIQI